MITNHKITKLKQGEISLLVLTMSGEAHRHLLEYNRDNDQDDNLDERVLDWVDDNYNTNDCWYVYSTTEILTFKDHTNE